MVPCGAGRQGESSICLHQKQSQLKRTSAPHNILYLKEFWFF